LKKIIVTGDDFGLSLAINEAIEASHRRGILTAASLMIGASAAGDAVMRARRLPTLQVGLHLVLVDGSPVLPVDTIPDLLDREGHFSPHLVRAGIHFFFSAKVRRQLEAEIRAQFQAFHDTGLPLDHVNSHHHVHLHPTVSGILLKVGKEYGLRAVRLPYESPIASWRASREMPLRKLGTFLMLYPWIVLLRARLRRENIRSNSSVFGMNDSGRMSLDLVLRFLKYLHDGVTEIYFHPVTSKRGAGSEGRDSQKELEALTSPEIQKTLLASCIRLIAFSDIEK
jgi:hopanoid biosynthesis associated protein HpnK